jgi:tripartite-type tricarboxylate transporter receptor subunit TctC
MPGDTQAEEEASTMVPRAAVARIAGALAIVAATGCAFAQGFPSRPVTLLIPFPPGTGNDVVGRIVGTKMGEHLSQKVVADNRAGASGNIAIEAARRATPDGHTMVIASTSFSINLYTMKTSYGLGDFTPIALIGKLPYTLMVNKSVPARNIDELAALLKARSGRYNGGSGGPTGTSFFLLDAFSKATGGNVQMISYKGTTAGVADLLAERTHLMFAPMVTSLPQYRAGKIQVHGVSGARRSPLMPDVATFTESGYPMLDVPTWFAFIGPAGIPADTVKVLSQAVGKALAASDVIEALSNQGVEPGFGTPAETAAFLKTDVAMWSRIVKDAGIAPQ